MSGYFTNKMTYTFFFRTVSFIKKLLLVVFSSIYVSYVTLDFCYIDRVIILRVMGAIKAMEGMGIMDSSNNIM